MENQPTTLVIAFDLLQGGKSIISNDKMLHNAFEINLGVPQKGAFILDLRSNMLLFLQYLRLQHSQDELDSQQTPGTNQAAYRKTIEIEIPASWQDFGHFRCEILEKESNPVCQLQEPSRLADLDRKLLTFQSERILHDFRIGSELPTAP